ncbi:hypothetical protein LOK49_LG09G01567 [Camellia lanceoleosa]|uniref:Uncharacterized protein n=1 Tax=Camellia lanceoleosa TaxID=1840588 RepID=A0ACC0GI06_9ERIC|nr:hypothetical protein LOK49_LG09G01567 [Camellia lanceoleosa]
MASTTLKIPELSGMAFEGLSGNEDLSYLCLLGKVLVPKPLNRSTVTAIICNAWRTRDSPKRGLLHGADERPSGLPMADTLGSTTTPQLAYSTLQHLTLKRKSLGDDDLPTRYPKLLNLKRDADHGI